MGEPMTPSTRAPSESVCSPPSCVIAAFHLEDGAALDEGVGFELPIAAQDVGVVDAVIQEDDHVWGSEKSFLAVDTGKPDVSPIRGSASHPGWSLPGRVETEIAEGAREAPIRTASKTDIDALCSSVKGSTERDPSMRAFGPTESIIFLDWDDTLCPTTSLRALIVDAKTPTEEQRQSLLVHQAVLTGFLRLAAELAHVAIVTMADKNWVKITTAKLMPDVATVVEELGIEIVSARESCPRWLLRCATSDDRDPSQYLKTKAMKRIIKQVSKTQEAAGSSPRHATHFAKNIISIGDSWAERRALQDLVLNGKGDGWGGACKDCHRKTLLMLVEPSPDQIIKELRIVTAVLPALVHYQGDIDVDLDQRDL